MQAQMNAGRVHDWNRLPLRGAFCTALMAAARASPLVSGTRTGTLQPQLRYRPGGFLAQGTQQPDQSLEGATSV